jgi:uncharacterized protein with NAD-binding domain and iron-sulfur cluster
MPKRQLKTRRGARPGADGKGRTLPKGTVADGSGSQKLPIRVAIIGGGCAGVAAAWHLSRNSKYEVSVYERSWRLGGKGASQRAADGRILEHGLHVWLGFYENAFRMMRDCYAVVERQNWGPHNKDERDRLAHARFEDAFFPKPHIGVFGQNSNDQVV